MRRALALGHGAYDRSFISAYLTADGEARVQYPPASASANDDDVHMRLGY